MGSGGGTDAILADGATGGSSVPLLGRTTEIDCRGGAGDVATSGGALG
jgi:hypothetical protein